MDVHLRLGKLSLIVLAVGLAGCGASTDDPTTAPQAAKDGEAVLVNPSEPRRLTIGEAAPAVAAEPSQDERDATALDPRESPPATESQPARRLVPPPATAVVVAGGPPEMPRRMNLTLANEVETQPSGRIASLGRPRFGPRRFLSEEQLPGSPKESQESSRRQAVLPTLISADGGDISHGDAAASDSPADATRPKAVTPPARLPAVLSPEREAELSRELQVVRQRARKGIERGFHLAERGAVFSARAEFIRALRVMTQALDTRAGGSDHSRALAEGLTALEEATDFMPPGAALEADLDLPAIVDGHETPVLQVKVSERLTALAALQAYFNYAQQRLATAAGREPAAAEALYALGRLNAEPNSRLSPPGLTAARAMTLHQAALVADPNNFRAANELGVLMARLGKWKAARQFLRRSVAVQPQAETWRNLAVVHRHLGENELATLALNEERLARQARQRNPQPLASRAPVRWVDASQFNRAGSNAVATGRAGATGPAGAAAADPSRRASPERTAHRNPATRAAP